MSDPRHVMEFYRSGTTKRFCIRFGITMAPRVGDGICVVGVMGKVVAVNWNLDYDDRPHQEWRCNVYIEEAKP